MIEDVPRFGGGVTNSTNALRFSPVRRLVTGVVSGDREWCCQWSGVEDPKWPSHVLF
jgi:hypothetical protein